MTTIRRIYTAAASSLLLLVLSACQSNQKQETAAAQNNAVKKVVVGSDASFPPMEFVDDNGNIVGFDVDLIKAIGKEAGLEVEVKNVAWDGIFGALKAGNVDVIASSVTITPERQAEFDFTRPYLKAGLVILVRVADAEKYPDLKALSSKAIGVQMSTTAAEFMQKQQGYELKQYNTAGLAVIDLANGNVEAVVIDKPVADYYSTKKAEFAQKLKVVGAPQTEEHFGFCVQKGKKELLEKLNSGLSKLQDNGTFKEIEGRWFR